MTLRPPVADQRLSGSMLEFASRYAEERDAAARNRITYDMFKKLIRDL